MSFFGALFAGITLFAKGVTAGQHIVNDNRSKNEARRLGSQRYYDHKGIMHDAKTGRAICYYTNPKNGHKLIQDAYTLNTIRDITAEEILEKRNAARDKAREEGRRYYELDYFDDLISIHRKIKHKLRWSGCATLYEKGKERFAKNSLYYSIDNFKYNLKGNDIQHCMVYSKLDEIGYYVKEYVDDIWVYTNIETGLVADIEDEMLNVLKKRKVSWDVLKETMNKEKIKREEEYGYIPMSPLKGVDYV